MSLPCGTCKAECCGPVVVTESLLEQVNAMVDGMDPQERIRLANQHRNELTCGFVDTEHNLCAIYSIRPGVCRVFGRTERLQCPHGTAPMFSEALVQLTLHPDMSSPFAILSTDFLWQ